MKKIIYTIIITFLLQLNLTSFAFSDVTQESPYFIAIDYLKSNGIINGHSDGSFKPYNPVNRAEALKMILLGTGISPDSEYQKPDFSDVSENDWFVPFLAKGVKEKIVNGNPDGSFAPGRKVNKAELLKMLLMSAKVDLSKHLSLSKAVSSDVGLETWYSPYFSYAKTVGIIYPDLENKLDPGKELNRAEVAEIIYRFIIIQKGGDLQKMLSIAESKLVSVLVDLKANDIESALVNASSAVFYTEQALAKKENDMVILSANKVSNAFRELCYAYKSGLNGEASNIKTHSEKAKQLAQEALTLNKDIKDLVEKINQQADLLLSQI